VKIRSANGSSMSQQTAILWVEPFIGVWIVFPMVSKTAARIWAIEPKHLLLSVVMFENLRRCELTSWRREVFEHLMNRYSVTFVMHFRRQRRIHLRLSSIRCGPRQDGSSVVSHVKALSKSWKARS
jgi:hypothetical protein